ncbi:MAG: pepN, partial [Gammaproteobacteria bacterium]|nr:pepN [Gammaproteobacteria bacterium]
FYTVTVYNKGAEVIRMLHTFVGEAGFRKGMDSYFERHDGQAVTIEDFVKAIAELNGFDYQPFLLWYSQSGTPQVDIKSEYHKHTKRYTLHFSQTCPPTPGQPLKNPFMIPVAMGLLDKTTGQELTSTVLSLTQEKQSFTFDNISAEVVPSLFRNFSAPVKVKYAYTDEELLHILQHDSDLFNRWDALQQLATELILELAEDYKENKPFYLNQAFAEGFRGLLNNKTLENRFLVECLVLPSENYLAQQVAIVHVDAIHAAREYVREALAKHCFETLLDCYQRHVKPTKYVYSKEAAAARALKNECLWYLMSTGSADIVRYCVQQFKSADNMTDQIAALAILANEAIPEADEALSSFYTTWRADHLVLDKWFSIQAYSKRPQAMERVKQLMRLPEYNPKNPNRVRALVGAFAMGNPVQFHALDNSGYAFLSDQIIVHHQANPQLAARLLTPLIQWRRFDEKRQALMKAQLMRLSAIPDLSRDVFEVVSKALA